MQRGQFVVASILALAVSLSALAVWYRSREQHRLLAAWTPAAALRVRHAARVEMLELDPPEAGATASGEDRLRIADESWPIRARHDMTGRRGLVHSRHLMIQDSNYRWDESDSEPPSPPGWRFAVRFSDGNLSTTIAFDVDSHRTLLVESGTALRMKPEAIELLDRYFRAPVPSK